MACDIACQCGDSRARARASKNARHPQVNYSPSHRRAKALWVSLFAFQFSAKPSMAVFSMTGYAAVQSSTDAAASGDSAGAAVRLGLEIRSVNSRFLDLAFRLPDELRQAEPALRELITQQIKRGKIELRAGFESQSNGAVKAPSTATLQRLNGLQDNIRAWLPQAQPLSVADVLRMANQEERSPQDQQPALVKLAKQALKELRAAREREGARLAHMLTERTAQLRALSEQARPLVPQLVEQQKNKFLERWRDAMALAEGSTLPEAAQDRALSEATAFAIRIDVAEELTRLASHLDEIDRLLAATYRARMLSQGHTPKIESKNKPGVTALREIAEGKIGLEMLKKVPL